MLIADDDALMQRSLNRYLAARGISVYAAQNRVDAVQLARLHLPDVALIDLHLGDDDGLDVVRELRLVASNTMLVMITGFYTTANVVSAMRSGAHDVIPKPFTASELISHLDSDVEASEIATLPLDDVIDDYVHRVLGYCSGNQSEAARRLNKPRSWLRRFLQRPRTRSSSGLK